MAIAAKCDLLKTLDERQLLEGTADKGMIRIDTLPVVASGSRFIVGGLWLWFRSLACWE